MKKVALLAASAVAVAVPAGAIASTQSASETKTIVGVAASDPQFSTLVSLVKKAGLVGALSGKQQLTVFAPTNAAFAKVPKATLTALGKDKKALQAVLTYHVVKGAVPASKVVTLKSAKTLNGATVAIKVTGGKVKVNNATVVKTDVAASNGVIHVINRVLIPPAK